MQTERGYQSLKGVTWPRPRLHQSVGGDLSSAD